MGFDDSATKRVAHAAEQEGTPPPSSRRQQTFNDTSTAASSNRSDFSPLEALFNAPLSLTSSQAIQGIGASRSNFNQRLSVALSTPSRARPGRAQLRHCPSQIAQIAATLKRLQNP